MRLPSGFPANRAAPVTWGSGLRLHQAGTKAGLQRLLPHKPFPSQSNIVLALTPAGKSLPPW
jgi:hypothetical protein